MLLAVLYRFDISSIVYHAMALFDLEKRNDSTMQKKKEGKKEECAFDHFDVLSSIEYLFMRESSIVEARDVVEECETGVCVKCARNSILVLTVLRFQC